MNAQIRLATSADAPATHAIYAPIVETTIISFELEPPTVAEITSRIESTVRQYPWLVCVADSVLLGYAYAGQHRSRLGYQWAADVSVYVHLDARKRRVGRALYTALLALLTQQGYYGAYAGIALPNPASVGLHEALGFTPVGVYHQVGYKLGSWYDVGWWECSLQPRADSPASPISIQQLLGSPAWDAAIALGEACLLQA